jgi:DNA repair exonuclease SbcCD ATPase subunit
MEKKNTGFDDIEKMLQEVGSKIETLIEKGTKVTGEASEEIEKKIKDLHKNKEKLEKEFQEKKAKFEEKYQSNSSTAKPFLEDSLSHFKQGVKSLVHAINEMVK